MSAPTSNSSSSELPSSVEIVIVGAGPAGLACALVLARAGVPFLLLDALQEGQNESRAAVVHAYTLEQLETVGTSVTEAIVNQGIQTRVLQPLGDSERPLGSLNIGKALEGRTKYPYALLVPQCDVERILESRLKVLSRDGSGEGVVRRGRRVVGVDDDDDADGLGAVVLLESGERVRATKAVVGTDGARSVVRSCAGAGITFQDPHTGNPSDHASPRDLQIVLADALLSNPTPNPNSSTDECERERLWPTLDARGFLLIIPLRSSVVPTPEGTHLYRVAATLPPGEEAPHSPDVAYIQNLLDTRGPGHTSPSSPSSASPTTTTERMRVVHIASGSRYRVRSALASHFVARLPRSGVWIALAGDAGHVHSPAGAQGMNLGLCDGLLLGRTLSSLSSSSQIPTDNAEFGRKMERYGEVRRRAAREVITFVERITALAGGSFVMRVPFAARVRDFLLGVFLALPGVQSSVAWSLSGLVHRDEI